MLFTKAMKAITVFDSEVAVIHPVLAEGDCVETNPSTAQFD